MIEIIREKETWDELVKKCDFADSYHTYDYHQLAKLDKEEAVLLHYAENGQSIILPLLIRDIEFSTYKDATSVYGYPGPITTDASYDFNIRTFQKDLNQCFKDQKIVSVFSRLNSFITQQEYCLLKMGIIETPGKVVYIDLNESLEKQWKGNHRRLRTYINKARTIYDINNANIPADLDLFIDLYYENMRRVKAKKEYFFEKKYFLDLINSSDFETEIILATSRKTGEVAGGALFMKKNNIIQYHLSGTSEIYLELNPLKLLIDEMRIRGKQQGYSYLNLGGGVGAKEDTLFYFKSGFSKHTLPFKVWKYIVNPSVYEDLVQQIKDIQHYQEALHYFPRYRVNRF